MKSTAEPQREDSGLQESIDRLSLEQALLDFEVANARVLDLTHRLVEATRTITELKTEIHRLEIEYAQLKSDHERMRSSKAFAIAQRIWTLRNAVRG